MHTESFSYTDADGRVWEKAAESGKQGNCIYVSKLDEVDVIIRSDQSPGVVLYATGPEFVAFREAMKRGQFDSYGGV